ncbi:MAG: phospholipase A2, partial [Ilumatobacteraceae bacterium]
DFGYRNLHLLDRRYGPGNWNSISRRRVDQQFLADMIAHCRSRAWYDEPTCFGWAEAFYTAVRIAGALM